MGSGFNGQSFAFHGYLPIEPAERAKKLKMLEQRVYNEHQTQLFIETPYRNNKMIEDILHNCRPQTKLCIAANITCEGEYIKTKTVREWQGKTPDFLRFLVFSSCINNSFQVLEFIFQATAEEVPSQVVFHLLECP